MHYKIRKTRIVLSKSALRINEQLVECSEKSHQAIHLFLKSDNTIVTKEYLIKSLWGDLIVSDDSLFKVIQCVRKIFNENGLVGVLENIYGKGYRLKDTIQAQSVEENIDSNHTAEYNSEEPLYSRIKLLSAVFLAVVILITSGYIFLTKNSEILINTKLYLDYKTKIRTNPKAFLSTIDAQYSQKKLDIRSQINLYTLKGYAHFALGHYEELFDYGQKAIDLAGTDKSLAIADNFLFFGQVYYYRTKAKKSLFYTQKAYQMYENLKNLDGMFSCQYIFLNLRYLAKDYEGEFNDAQEVFEQAKKHNHGVGKILSLLHMSYASSELNRDNGGEEYALQALEVALEIKNKDFISLCYGVLAQDNRVKGNYIKAMKWANEILKYAVSQPNTNLFMQGFSYMYNVLSPLGYDQLAEKYLQKGIDLQAHLNNEGHLHEAEINLAILKIKLAKYKQAQKLLLQLTGYKLSVIDKVRVQAWIAINQVKMHDNISAYATAKETFNNVDSTDRVKFIAGIALTVAASELEREEESNRVFEKTSHLAKDKWLIEYRLFLDVEQIKMRDDVDGLKRYQQKRKIFEQKQAQLKEQAQPNAETLKELDTYLARVLSE